MRLVEQKELFALTADLEAKSRVFLRCALRENDPQIAARLLRRAACQLEQIPIEDPVPSCKTCGTTAFRQENNIFPSRDAGLVVYLRSGPVRTECCGCGRDWNPVERYQIKETT